MINEFNFSPGERLVLELQSEVIEGDYDSGSKNRIDLINITDRLTNIKIKDKLSFYRTDIVDIRYLDKPDDATSKNKEQNGCDNTTSISQVEHNRLKKLTQNFIYIDKKCANYKQAVDRLKNAEHVGVVGLCSKLHEIDKIKILVMSTIDQIYIFDLFVWNCDVFPSELAEILCSDTIRKVVHDSRLLKARLWKCHQIELEHIFDTQVADAMIYENENGKKREEMRHLLPCLSDHLHLSDGLLEQVENVDTETWDKRPLDYFQIIQAAFLGTYLITLKKHLQRIMLKHFHKVNDMRINSLKSKSLYHATAYTNKIPEEQREYVAKVLNDLFM